MRQNLRHRGSSCLSLFVKVKNGGRKRKDLRFLPPEFHSKFYSSR